MTLNEMNSSASGKLWFLAIYILFSFLYSNSLLFSHYGMALSSVFSLFGKVIKWLHIHCYIYRKRSWWIFIVFNKLCNF